MDDKCNVYVDDTANLAIRKIGDASITTIAGWKSNVAGYRDGPSEDAKFSANFDVIYLRPTRVSYRQREALRQISLNQDDCDHQYSSLSVEEQILEAKSKKANQIANSDGLAGSNGDKRIVEKAMVRNFTSSMSKK
ncbi:hypothetical protein AgCh_005378 [Apium graveolens]